MIELKDISKSFGEVRALDRVSVRIERGAVQVLLGENGAGKSTLMKILYGMYVPDGGTISFDGKRVTLHNSHQSIRMGVGMVHQHFMLVDEFTGYENIALGFEPRKGLSIDRREIVRAVDEIAVRAGICIDASRKIADMTVGEKQKIEILKLLYRKSEILILDEPTAVLTPNEVTDLFSMIRSLVADGKGVVLITHKLAEALEIADTITVLRDGRVVAEGIVPAATDRHGIAAMMVGREVSLYARRPAKNVGDERFAIGDLSVVPEEGCAVDGISLTVKKGEIVGIAGVDGNGQRELTDAIAGLCRIGRRDIRLDGAPLPDTTRAVLESGVGFVFEDRSLNGIVADMSVAENIILGYHRNGTLKTLGFLSRKKMMKFSQDLIARYGIKTPSASAPARDLSGGNQQKIVLARVLSSDPKVAVISQPTRGVDIGAMEYIHGAIFSYRDAGNAVLLVSADLDEVKSLSDRLLVMYDGRIVAEGRPDEFSDTQLGLHMTGSSPAACGEMQE